MGITQAEIRDRLDHLLALKQDMRTKKNEYDEAKDLHDRYEHELWQDMAGDGMTGFKTDRAGYTRKATTYATVQDMEAFEDWLHARGLADEFLKSAPEKQRLNEIVRACIDNGEPLPDGVGYYNREYISIQESK